jgi:hypothetical protein
VRAEPFEFSSKGGGGGTLLGQVKRRKSAFYEIIIRRLARMRANLLTTYNMWCRIVRDLLYIFN